MKSVQIFNYKFDLVDKFRNEHRGMQSFVRFRYIDQVQAKIVDVSFLSFHCIFYSDHKLVRVRENLDKPNVGLVGF